MGLLKKHEKKLFIHNLNNIIKAKGCNAYNIHNEIPDFPISRTTLLRWINTDTLPNKNLFTNSNFLSFYNEYFEPNIDNPSLFYKQEITELKAKDKKSLNIFSSKYQGLYFIYYFSNHYENIIHSGKILLYQNSNQIEARMVIGIQNERQYEDKLFDKIFNNDINNDEAYIFFLEYKKSLETKLLKRCYFYEGIVHFDDYIIEILFNGKGKHHRHHQNLYLVFNKSKYDYIGGLGLVLATPNNQHLDYRCYKMGLSRFKLQLNDRRIGKLLKMNVSEYNRIVISPKDDLSWYDLVLLKE